MASKAVFGFVALDLDISRKQRNLDLVFYVSVVKKLCSRRYLFPPKLSEHSSYSAQFVRNSPMVGEDLERECGILSCRVVPR